MSENRKVDPTSDSVSDEWFRPGPDEDVAPLEEFGALIDKFERLLLVQDARRIKVEEHPTRERLLDAVLWALGEAGEPIEWPSLAPAGQREFLIRFRAELRRVAGL